ncbi:MAG: hypothetical protein ACI828_001370 [Flavobacteriales bacterium]|jgi:hypothetical protein
MSPRNKTYVCFDADQDTRYYDLMKDWEANTSFPFHFDNDYKINKLIGVQSDEEVTNLLKDRLQNAKVLVILIGKNTRNLYKYVRFEIDYALKNFIPIIGVHIGVPNKQNEVYFPMIKNQMAAYIPFSLKELDNTLTHSSKRLKKLKINNNSSHFLLGATQYGSA